jgi:processive 1,2-diacylglycerol beta-glucosyltransferase
MDASDILITKPGGLTSSEALAKGLPMVITNPIPGQEERNARYLVKEGVAERADDPAEIAETVQSLITHPQRLRRMTERTREIAKPYAAMEVARHIFRMVSLERSVGHAASKERERRPLLTRFF